MEFWREGAPREGGPDTTRSATSKAGVLAEGVSRSMLITGATGFIGSHLAESALSRGYRVKTLTRRDWAEGPPVPVENRYLGELPRRIPRDALEGVEVLVHCAASFDREEQKAFAVNVEGTARLAMMARSMGVRTFVFLSSQSARPDAISSYGRSKFEAEQRLLAETGLAVVILRPGLVTGIGGGGLFGRIVRIVRSWPVVPLMGGGVSIVQPIRVDDLCSAIFQAAELEGELRGCILNLGHPVGMSLAQLVQEVAQSQLGHRKATVSIPLKPVELVLGAAEWFRMRLPITTENLNGLKLVERMKTAEDYSRLGIPVRPLSETVRGSGGLAYGSAELDERSVRVLLVGAGRVGLIHAVTLSRLRGVVLSGIVDPRRRARAFLEGIGISAPGFGSVEEALSQTRPDAVVIATPGSTHFTLVRACLARGLAVLVEKPLAISARQLEDYAALRRDDPDCIVQVGYVMPRNPQISSCLDRFRAGEFGRVRGFLGLTLLSLIREPDPARWEVRQRISGGGSLINAGGHVLSMIREAFGDPESISGQTTRLFSSEVEDSVAVTLKYPEFSGDHFCSWSIEGFPRQENTLVVRTDRGRLVLTGSVGLFVRDDGECDLTHQLDFDIGFNLAPDYAGGGFTAEMNDLAKAVRTGRPAPMDLVEATGVERLLFKIYEQSKSVSRFEGKQSLDLQVLDRLTLKSDSGRATRRAIAVRRILDLRDVPLPFLHAAPIRQMTDPQWDGYVVTPPQSRLANRFPEQKEIRVTVPDFLNQARLLSMGRYGEVLRQFSLPALVRALTTAGKAFLRERQANFWVAGMGLLRAALEQVPDGFQGTLLVHGYLTDLALSLGQIDTLDEMLAMCRKRRPLARIGFHTNMAEDAGNALRVLRAQVDEVSVLSSPNAIRMSETLESMRGGQRTLTAEVGLAPSIVHRLAVEDPSPWAHGADAVLIGPGGDTRLASDMRRIRANLWAEAFPGLEPPPELA